MEKNDSYYMHKALDLAKKGLGYARPNPMVGCVIVHNNEIIGQGYHERCGELHAEPNAVNSVQDKNLIHESTVYVTLEPCAHHGKTPPCADLLVSLKPQRVVICNTDPNPLVAGKGISKLKHAGIEVITGVLEQEGKELNKRFFSYQEKKRPYIILKWAQTIDGFIARENYDSKWISGADSRKLVHLWRTEEAAIMVGTNTALHDNPQLTARGVEGQNPLRIVLDKNLRIPTSFNLFDKSEPTIVYTTQNETSEENLEYVQLDFSKDLIQQVLNDLYNRNITSLFVEGGRQLLSTFLELNLWDEARVFKSKSREFEKGVQAPKLKPIEPKRLQQLEDDLLEYYYNTKLH